MATATVDGTILPMAGMPESAAQDVGHIHLNLQFAVADAAHFRLDIAQTEPGFDADPQTFSADGSAIRAYFAGEREALKSGLHSGPAHPAFNTSGGQALGVALVREDRVALTPTGATMKKTGSGTLLGRAVDVYTIAPLLQINTRVCSTSSAARKACRWQREPYGKATVWIDRQHGAILKYMRSGLPVLYGSSYTYAVTSITYRAPTTQQLQFVPPSPPISVNSVFPTGASTAKQTTMDYWTPPKGWYAMRTYASPTWPWTIAATGYRDDPPVRGKPIMNAALAKTGASVEEALMEPAGNRLNVPSHPYLYVQERYFVPSGATQIVPYPLEPGSNGRYQVRGCTDFYGTYADGATWMWIERFGGVSILWSSNTLTTTQMIDYLKQTTLCLG